MAFDARPWPSARRVRAKTSASAHRKLNKVRELGVHCRNGRLFSYQKHGCRHAGPRSAAMRGLERNSPGRSPSKRTPQEIPTTARPQRSIGTQWPRSKGLASHPYRKREWQRRRPAVDVSSTLSQYQQPKEAGSRKTGAKSSPRKHKNRANRRNQQSVPTPRAGLEAETEGESQKVRLQARRAGRPAPVDADEKRVLCCFSVLNVRP